MTAEVISLAAHRPDPHLSGEARCTGCAHEWVAVAPVGVWQLECPSCRTMHGVWRFPVGGDEDDPVLFCNCGCEAMTAYLREGRTYLRCMRCGTDQTSTLFGTP